ncbi:MAG: hypothetical protein JNL72_09685 [Flavipsychrobacter sp.]|nr:hypothetical protein [Flavipsychrobacter sp.]
MITRLIASLLLFFSVSLSVPARAQDDVEPGESATLAQLEDSLVVYADSIYEAPIPDTRLYYNDKFVKLLVRALKAPNSYSYPFKKLDARMNILISPDDKSFRMFNWVIAAPNDEDRRYYGAIQLPGETLKLFGLSDYSDKMTAAPEDSVLTGGKWFGALYYRIMSREVDGETVYMMFGVNEASRISKKKLIDPMVLTDKGPRFGAPVFALNNKAGRPYHRFVLEYKKSVNVSLNWDEEKKLVYFDRLTSEDPNRKYTYVPTSQYDGFRWQNGKWNIVKDIIPVMEMKDGEAPSGAPITPETK